MDSNNQNTILVVDDDPSVLDSISLLLKKYGYIVISCERAKDVFNALQEEKIDAVLSDVKMPEISGIELLEKIHTINSDIPVILMTAYTDFDITVDAIKKGVFDFIIKPYQPEQILHSVDKAVKYKNFLEMEKSYKHLLEEFNQEIETLVSERTMNLMALTIADRVRNPAMVIGSKAKKMAEKKDVPEDFRKDLLCILEETEKLQTMVKDFHNLLKSRKSKFSYDDINEVAESVVSSVEKRDVTLVVNLSEQPLRINMEKDLLRVAISLLIKNALEAMPENGRLTIETGQEEEEVFLRISDTGPGIPANSLENIFVPFFSTKKRGFGLGLPLVKQIVSEHLGKISVKSEEGKGTTFSLTFPSRWKDR